MSVAAIAGTARIRPSIEQLRLEHVVMGGAILCLIVLVVFPLLSLLLGSVRGEQGISLDNFAEVMSGRLYVNALKNSLTLGAWTGVFSLIIGVSLAWAVSRTDVPGKPLIQITATSFLSVAAVPHRHCLCLPVQSERWLDQRPPRDVLGLPLLTFNIFSMTGLVLVTVLHTFPFVYLLASSALLSVDASYEEAAQILGASKFRTAISITTPLVAPAILSGTLLAFVNAIALFGSQAIIGLPGRIVTLPTRIYALFDYPPEYGLASALSLLFIVITVVALYLQRAFLARRSYVTLAGKGARPQLMSLGPARWLVFGFAVSASLWPLFFHMDADCGELSKSWGLDFWKGLTLANYKFILFEYNVTQRAILNSLSWRRSPRRSLFCWGDHRLDRSAHPYPRPQAARLFRTHSAGASRHCGRGGAHSILARPCHSRSTAHWRSCCWLTSAATSLSGSARRIRRCGRSILLWKKARKSLAPRGSPPCAR